MQWSKAIIAGVVGGIVNAVYGFLLHGLVMGKTYQKYAVFRTDANVIWFIIIPILLGVVGALFFAKSRASWSAGMKGGITFGFWIGLIGFVANFYTPLMYAGFPYFLTWCTGTIMLIGWMVYGAVIGAMYKTATA
ncbi:MAG: hypothetical protein ONB44_11870 [candidate division KSB1 bacterium]|nr:hypothetical protein [candidate division KSB1 bacterium]MDZ7302820.1 hypothetical protein [candidate division KSB1 bacterium]MDZ7311837.1 hypothetical protein [candidate division KSB1 bacterium]